MADVPLRHRLLYDPVFLDLSRRFRGGFFGRIEGVGASAAVGSPAVLSELCCFFLLFFGRPERGAAFSDLQAALGRVFLFYPSFALSLDASFVPAAVPADTGLSLSGSAACERAVVEFRYGRERFAAYAPPEAESRRLAVPEGDGAFYRLRDQERPGGPRLAGVERDAEAAAYAAELLGSRFAAFPGGAP